ADEDDAGDLHADAQAGEEVAGRRLAAHHALDAVAQAAGFAQPRALPARNTDRRHHARRPDENEKPRIAHADYVSSFLVPLRLGATIANRGQSPKTRVLPTRKTRRRAHGF